MASEIQGGHKFGPDANGKNRYGNIPVPFFFKLDAMHAFEKLELKSTDIILNTMPKAGTNFLFRAVQGLRLINSEGSNDPDFGYPLYPEGLPAETPSEPCIVFKNHTQSDIYEQEDPRVFITHLPAFLLPESIKSSGRYIYITRNPKDAMTSLHFFRGEPKDGWEGTFKRFMAPNPECPNAYGSYFDHMLHAQELLDIIGDRGHVVHFEKLKENFKEELTRLARFLDFELSDAKLEKIVEVTSFKKMKSENNQHAKMIMRKGEKNDHKNYLDELKWAQVDSVFAERLQDCAIARDVSGMNL